MLTETGTLIELDCEFANVLQEIIRSIHYFSTKVVAIPQGRNNSQRPVRYMLKGLYIYHGFPYRSHQLSKIALRLVPSGST
jgi:hypothetical protein